MRTSDIGSCASKLADALKTFRTTLAGVESQWDDAARRRFEEEHLSEMDLKVKGMIDAISRLADVFASAERQCNDDF